MGDARVWIFFLGGWIPGGYDSRMKCRKADFVVTELRYPHVDRLMAYVEFVQNVLIESMVRIL